MKLTEAERGMLQSKMSDETVASIFERPLSWVRKARQHLVLEQAADLARWNGIGGEVAGTPKRGPKPRLAGKRADQILVDDPSNPEAMCIFRLSIEEAKSNAPLEELHQIDLEEVIAEVRLGAPAELKGAALASWLYDNTDATFEKIAELASLQISEVQAIANGDELPEPAPMKVMREKIVRRPPAAAQVNEAVIQSDTTYVASSAVGMRDLYTIKALTQAPATFKVKVTAFAEKKDATTRTLCNVVARPHAEIPARVLRWARWFIDAGWRLTEVADLFEVDPEDLRAELASGLTKVAAQG